MKNMTTPKTKAPAVHYSQPTYFYQGLCGAQLHHRLDGQTQRTEDKAAVTCWRCKRELRPCATNPTHGYHAGRCGIA
jgi:hypothetical protein